MPKTCHFSFEIRMKHKFSLSKNRNILKKSKYQQYFHCFIACILVSYAFRFSYQQNIVTILVSVTFRVAGLIKGEALIRGRRLFQCGYPKVRHLLEGSAYLRPGACQRKYGRSFFNSKMKKSSGKQFYVFDAFVTVVLLQSLKLFCL